MIQGFNESTLGTSEIFNGLKETTGVDQYEKIIKIIKTGKHLTNMDIEGAYVGVKQYSNTLSKAAVLAFDEGKTVLLYNNVPTLSPTQALPFITLKRASGGYTTYVFLDRYVTMSRDGVYSIPTNILHDLLIGALISNKLKSGSYDQLASNQFLSRLLMDIYTKFVTHILNREFSIKADKVVFDTLIYWVNKFFLMNVLGSNDTPENLEILSIKPLKYVITDEMKLEEIKNAYDEAGPSKISELLELCKTSTTRMGSLSLATFSSNWISYFYPASFLAIDVIEYLIFMVWCLLHGNGTIVSIAASEMVKETKNIKGFREELVKLI